MGPELPFLGGRVVGVWPPAQIRHVGFRWQGGNERTGGTLLSSWWWRKHQECLFTRLLSRPLFLVFPCTFCTCLFPVNFCLWSHKPKKVWVGFFRLHLSLDRCGVATWAAELCLYRMLSGDVRGTSGDIRELELGLMKSPYAGRHCEHLVTCQVWAWFFFSKPTSHQWCLLRQSE